MEIIEPDMNQSKLIFIYLTVNVLAIIIVSIITNYINKNSWLQEVGKEKVLLFNINIYRDLGIKASMLKNEAFRIISNSLNKMNKMRAEGRSIMQMWENIEEEFNPENLLHHISSLKHDSIYLPDDMIATIKELEDLYWEVFAELDYQKFRQAQKFIELTDKLLSQIRKNTADIMSRKIDISKLLYVEPEGGFASNRELNVAKQLADILQEGEKNNQ